MEHSGIGPDTVSFQGPAVVDQDVPREGVAGVGLIKPHPQPFGGPQVWTQRLAPKT